MKAM
ncbi:unnamed protein product, partial [Litomosoides sigmodontis]